MKKLMKVVLGVAVLAVSGNLYANVTGVSNGQIHGIRVEGSTALISLSQHIDDSGHTCSRVWLDLTKDYENAIYSTVLMAFVTNKTVQIRAVANSTKRYGACDLYDIYIPKQ